MGGKIDHWLQGSNSKLQLKNTIFLRVLGPRLALCGRIKYQPTEDTISTGEDEATTQITFWTNWASLSKCLRSKYQNPCTEPTLRYLRNWRTSCGGVVMGADFWFGEQQAYCNSLGFLAGWTKMLLNLLWIESHVHPFKTQAVTLHLEIVIQKRTIIAMNALIFRSVQISNVGETCFTLDIRQLWNQLFLYQRKQ